MMRLGVEAVGIDECRIGHTQEEFCIPTALDKVRDGRARLVREVMHLTLQDVHRHPRTVKAAVLLKPGLEASVATLEPSVVRLNQQPHGPSLAASLFCKKCSGELVIESDPPTLPFFALHQAPLPRGVRLPYVVPKASERCQVASTERPSQITGEPADIA